MPTSNKVEPATAGLTFTDMRFDEERTFTVADKCDENQGHWFCITHKVSFDNQMMKDGHIHSGDHVLAWVCHYHGPEVP